jgi:Rad3-related DNA helicase
MELLDAPLLLEGGTGLGKTRAYLAAIKEYEGTVAIVLPTIQLMDQLLASSDLEAVGLQVEAFRRADLFGSRSEYTAHREQAMQSRVLLCTSASIMIDQRLRGDYNGATNRDYLLFDEADQLPSAAALRRDLTITEFELRDAGISLTTSQETIDQLFNKQALPSELKAKAKVFQEALDQDFWFQKIGINDEGGLELFHELPGRLIRRICNQPNTAFISATLSIAEKFDDFRRSMGIDSDSRLSGMIEPIKHGSLSFNMPTDKTPKEVIENAELPCLVATTSHDQTEQLGLEIKDAILRTREETTADAASRVKEDGILIAAGAWAGLDTPIQWASIVVPKIPFDRPTVLDKEIESHYINSRNVAIRRMRQVLGRGLRTPEAECTIYILDERNNKLGDYRPHRFGTVSWDEGGIEQKLKNERKRMKSIRPAALKHYEKKCYSCSMVPQHISQIDIHHLDPITGGERKTVLKDVIPLCSNCHKLVHSCEPMYSLQEVKEILNNGLTLTQQPQN